MYFDAMLTALLHEIFPVRVLLRQTASPWLYVVPSGMKDMLLWIASRYSNTPVIVTETGNGLTMIQQITL